MIQTADRDLKEWALAKGDDLLPENFPELGNLSAAHLLAFVPRPNRILLPEFVYLEVDKEDWLGEKRSLKTWLTICQWNALWEAGHLRSEFVPQVIGSDLLEELKWLSEVEKANLYLVPDCRRSKYAAFKPLYHLLPKRTLDKFGLPPLKRSTWPPWIDHHVDPHITGDFDDRVAAAFASHVWPLLSPGARITAFSKDDPIMLLTHNLNYWLPSVYEVAEDRLREFPRVGFDSEDQVRELRMLRDSVPAGVQVDRPLKGGSIWCGEDDAWVATQELVDVADKDGQLRAIVDAVKAHRIEDDFSNIWSHAKEDFERKLYHKRSKVRVFFVELDKTTPVHAPTSELHDDLLWEDFLALLDIKERRIVVCLRSGITRVGEIAERLGYANHSPVSKALKRIHHKTRKYLDL